jgi:thiamine pyrophosphate-dependent acetolactate synthase large subunit-like protein
VEDSPELSYMSSNMYTTSSVFLQTLVSVGITHVFVNWGSDHPALLEDVARRLQSSDVQLKFITCPNEMVALTAAQGFAQVTGKPAAVIVHVDVGTQALAGAVHNVDRGGVPVLIYAGASPFTLEGELKGSRNEWIMWVQDASDQAAVVRQYMRYTGQINSGKNVSQVVKRSLQIATSEPKGPVYLWARREVMEEELDESYMDIPADNKLWPRIAPSGLSSSAIRIISEALANAKAPLIITSRLPKESTSSLIRLSELLAIPIFFACPSISSVPLSHPNVVGLSYLNGRTNCSYLPTADVIIVLESDLPWLTFNGGVGNVRDLVLKHDARVFILDSQDPLKPTMGMWHVPAELICRTDSNEALLQITQALQAKQNTLNMESIQTRALSTQQFHDDWTRKLLASEEDYSAGLHTHANIMGILRHELSRMNILSNTLVMNEGISAYEAIWSHLLAVGSDSGLNMLTSGGASLGWSLAASIGGHLGLATSETNGKKLVVALVGDGSYLFGVPSSAFWIARKYDTPFLTIVLNNGGWQSPKLSMLGVHPQGIGAPIPGHELSVGFGPHIPDYAGIAVAATAGWAYGKKVRATEGKQVLQESIKEAVHAVLVEGRCAVLECELKSI